MTPDEIIQVYRDRLHARLGVPPTDEQIAQYIKDRNARETEKRTRFDQELKEQRKALQTSQRSKESRRDSVDRLARSARSLEAQSSSQHAQPGQHITQRTGAALQAPKNVVESAEHSGSHEDTSSLPKASSFPERSEEKPAARQEKAQRSSRILQSTEALTPSPTPSPISRSAVTSSHKSPKKVTFSSPHGGSSIPRDSSISDSAQKLGQEGRSGPPPSSRLDQQKRTFAKTLVAVPWMTCSGILIAVYAAFILCLVIAGSLGVQSAWIPPSMPPPMPLRLQNTLPNRVQQYRSALPVLHGAQVELTYAYRAYCQSLEAACQLLPSPQSHTFYNQAVADWKSSAFRSCPQPRSCMPKYQDRPSNEHPMVSGWQEKMAEHALAVGDAVRTGVSTGDALVSPHILQPDRLLTLL